jgi:hypothetical protein
MNKNKGLFCCHTLFESYIFFNSAFGSIAYRWMYPLTSASKFNNRIGYNVCFLGKMALK